MELKFYLPNGQVNLKFYLPPHKIYLPRAGGQCLMSSPAVCVCVTPSSPLLHDILPKF